MHFKNFLPKIIIYLLISGFFKFPWCAPTQKLKFPSPPKSEKELFLKFFQSEARINKVKIIGFCEKLGIKELIEPGILKNLFQALDPNPDIIKELNQNLALACIDSGVEELKQKGISWIQENSGLQIDQKLKLLSPNSQTVQNWFQLETVQNEIQAFLEKQAIYDCIQVAQLGLLLGKSSVIETWIKKLSNPIFIKKIKEYFKKEGYSSKIFIVFNFCMQSNEEKLKETGINIIQECLNRIISTEFKSFRNPRFKLFDEEKQNFTGYLRLMRYLEQLIENKENSFLSKNEKKILLDTINEFLNHLSTEKNIKNIKRSFNICELVYLKFEAAYFFKPLQNELSQFFLQWLSKNALKEAEIYIKKLRENSEYNMQSLVMTIQFCLQSGTQELQEFGRKILKEVLTLSPLEICQWSMELSGKTELIHEIIQWIQSKDFENIDLSKKLQLIAHCIEYQRYGLRKKTSEFREYSPIIWSFLFEDNTPAQGIINHLKSHLKIIQGQIDAFFNDPQKGILEKLKVAESCVISEQNELIKIAQKWLRSEEASQAFTSNQTRFFALAYYNHLHINPNPQK